MKLNIAANVSQLVEIANFYIREPGDFLGINISNTARTTSFLNESSSEWVFNQNQEACQNEQEHKKRFFENC